MTIKKPKKRKNPIPRLRAEADKLWKARIIEGKPVCEACDLEPTITAHHFFPKSNWGYLRYDLDNGIAIGQTCHFDLHFKDDPTIVDRIIKKRGQEWFNRLKEKSKLKPPKSYINVGYYKNAIEKL